MLASTRSIAARLRRRGGRIGAGTAAAVGLALLAACGGGGSNVNGVSGATHDSPDGAVRGFIGAIQGYNGSPDTLNPVLDWVQPSKRDQAKQGLNLVQAFGGANVKVSFKVDNFDIDKVDQNGDQATVHIKGTASYCISGTVAGQNLNTCDSSLTTGQNNTVHTVRVNGQWYIADLGGSGSSSSSSSSTSSSVGGGASSSDTGGFSSGASSSSSTDTGTSSST